MSYEKKLLSIVFLALLMILPGCFPKRIVWSPDGATAAVWASEGLYFSDADGKLSGKVYGEIFGASWLSDNQRLVVQRKQEVKTWSEIEQLAGARLKNEIVSLAKQVVAGTINDKSELDRLFGKNMSGAVELYINKQNPDTVSKEVFEIYVIELCSWKDGKFQVEKELGRFGAVSLDISISPSDKVVMLSQCDMDGGEDDDVISRSQLWLVETGSGKSVMLAKGVSMYPSWSNDGNSVIYASKETVGDGDGIFFGQLVSVGVTQENGLLVDKVTSPRTLAGAVMSIWTRVRVLPDGKVIFPSLSISLPAVPDDITEQMDLFILEPDINIGVSRVGIKDKLEKLSGYDMNFFEVSDNGRYVSLVDHDGRVAVLDLSSGAVTVLQGEDIGNLRSIPDWRSASEITYLSQVNENGQNRDVVMCWDMSKTGDSGRELSKSWPDEVGFE